MPLPDENGVLHDGFIDVAYRPYRESSGEIKGVLAIVLDVTEQVRARKTIEDALAQLTEERDIREQFVTTLTHDLRTPLGVVLLSGKLLQNKLDDPPTLTLLAQRIDRNVRRVDSLIGNLLDANRLTAGERMPLAVAPGRLDQLMQGIFRGLTELHGDRLRVRNEPGALPGLWDGTALERVVENLVGNALKYGAPEAPITVGLTRLDDGVELSVHNEGPAISPDEQVAIFRPFHRTYSAAGDKHSGWGVGLTLVKGIAEAHGGSVRVQSASTGGTTFFVRLPIAGRASS